eukprot:885144-Prorocentrum_minimum.AAC.2
MIRRWWRPVCIERRLPEWAQSRGGGRNDAPSSLVSSLVRQAVTPSLALGNECYPLAGRRD